MSFAYTGQTVSWDRAKYPATNSPFVKEYGYLQTSHVFFLLWASHVVKLDTSVQLCSDPAESGPRTSLGVCSESCRSICMDKREVGLALLVRCISDMYLVSTPSAGVHEVPPRDVTYLDPLAWTRQWKYLTAEMVGSSNGLLSVVVRRGREGRGARWWMLTKSHSERRRR